MKEDFFNEHNEGIKIMTFKELAEYIKGFVIGQSVRVYITVDRNTEKCDWDMTVSKLMWNGTQFYVLGKYGYDVQVINCVECDYDDFIGNIKHAFSFYNANKAIGVVVSTIAETPMDKLIQQMTEEHDRGYRYIFVYHNEEEMHKDIGDRLCSICDNEGKHLCNLLYHDMETLLREGHIVETKPIKDMKFASDWAIANATERDKVWSYRVVILYTHTITKIKYNQI